MPRRARLTALFALFAATLLAPHAAAQTLAQQYQAQHTVTAWPGPYSSLRQLFGNLAANGELAWPADGGPAPFGTPAGATEVLIARFHRTHRWSRHCGVSCTLVESACSTTIRFADGSSYFYSFMWSDLVCTDGTRSRSESILDSASTGQPNTFRLRSQFTQVSGSRTITRTKLDALRAPVGATTDLGPLLLAPSSADTPVEIRTGPAGVLDLRGHDGSAPLLAGAIPAAIYADSILLDPGVSLSQLFSPAPAVNPGAIVQSIVLQPARYPALPGPAPDAARVRAINLGNAPVMMGLTWFDSAGWFPPGSSSLALAPGESASLAFPVNLPALAPPGDPLACEPTTFTLAASTGGTGTTALQLLVLRDRDDDGDSWKNSVDLCPDLFNPSQEDADLDGHGDACDNCALFNPFQDDYDADGAGDACDPPCPVDADLNGLIEPVDVGVFVGTWFAGLTGGTLDGDFDANGFVQPADVGSFVTAWFAALAGGC